MCIPILCTPYLSHHQQKSKQALHFVSYQFLLEQSPTLLILMMTGEGQGHQEEGCIIRQGDQVGHIVREGDQQDGEPPWCHLGFWCGPAEGQLVLVPGYELCTRSYERQGLSEREWVHGQEDGGGDMRGHTHVKNACLDRWSLRWISS